jgi:hypothetical protein
MRVTDARLIRFRDFCQFEAWVTLESVQTPEVTDQGGQIGCHRASRP